MNAMGPALLHCRSGSMNSVLVEFEADGYRVVTSRYAVRQIKED